MNDNSWVSLYYALLTGLPTIPRELANCNFLAMVDFNFLPSSAKDIKNKRLCSSTVPWMSVHREWEFLQLGCRWDGSVHRGSTGLLSIRARRRAWRAGVLRALTMHFEMHRYG